MTTHDDPVAVLADVEKLRRRFITLRTLAKKWIRRIAVAEAGKSTDELAEQFLAGGADLSFARDCASRPTFPALLKETRAVRTMTGNLLEALHDAGRMDEWNQLRRVSVLIDDALAAWQSDLVASD